LAERQDRAETNLKLLVFELPDSPIEKFRHMVTPRKRSLTCLRFGLFVGGPHALPSEIDANGCAQHQS
jgi:hypothetical protein